MASIAFASLAINRQGLRRYEKDQNNRHDIKGKTSMPGHRAEQFVVHNYYLRVRSAELIRLVQL